MTDNENAVIVAAKNYLKARREAISSHDDKSTTAQTKDRVYTELGKAEAELAQAVRVLTSES